MCGYAYWRRGFTVPEYDAMPGDLMADWPEEERMSTTFKDGLRARLAEWLREGAYYDTEEALLGTGPRCGAHQGLLHLAVAALAYCEEWEECEVYHYLPDTIFKEERWYRGPDGECGERATILIRREPPKPTVDIEKAKREIKKLREDVILRKLCVEARIREALEALGEKEDR